MLVYGLLVFLIGIAVAPALVPGLTLWVILGISAGAFYFARSRRVLLYVLVLAVLFSGGIFRFIVADAHTLLESYVAHEVVVEGYIDSDPNVTGAGASYYFRTSVMNGEPISERILVRTESWPIHSLGTPLVVSGLLELPWEGDGFDYRSYLKKNGVRTVLNRPMVEPLSEVHIPLWRRVGLEIRRSLVQVRDLMQEGVQRSVPEPAGAYLNGILLGVRDDIPADLEESFSRTGTTHVLAISGYNVAIIAEGFLLLCLRITQRKKAVWIAIVGIAAFALLTGAEASVVRAAIMGSLILIAQAWGRKVNVLMLVLLAAAAMTMVNPYLIRHDVGFQLSFAAVLGLVYLSPLLERFWRAPGSLKEGWYIATATVAANTATLPLILYHFGTLPIYSLPANMMILPVVPFAMAWGAFASLVSLIAPVASGIIGIPAWALATWQLSVVRVFGDLPGATVDIHLPFVAVVIAYGTLIAIYMTYGNRRDDNTA